MLRARPPAKKRKYVDPEDVDIGTLDDLPAEEMIKATDCLARALGVDKATDIDFTRSLVPAGCREVPLRSVTLSSSPCKKGEVELLIGEVYTRKDGKPTFVHAVGRDPSGLLAGTVRTQGWRTRLGTFGASENPASTGNFVRDIRDYNKHFNWYIYTSYQRKPDPKWDVRALCCDISKLRIEDGVLK
jgi:hypothetical protein